MGERTKNTLRNIFFGFISKIVTLLLPFVVRTVIIYKLGAAFVGIGSLFTSMLQILSVTELGFGSAISFTMYPAIAIGDIEKVKKSINLLRTVYICVGLIILVIGICLLPFLHFLIKENLPSNANIYVLYLIYLSNTVITYLFCGYQGSVLSANQRYDVISKIELIMSILSGISQILVLLIFSDYIIYSFLIPFFTAIKNIIVSRYSKKYFPELVVTDKLSLKGMRNIAKQIGGIGIGRITLMCRNSFDSIIISSLMGLTTLAIYSNYYLIITTVASFLSVILISMGASVGNSLALETMGKNEVDHIKFDFYYEVIIGFCTICLFSLLQPFMKLWVGQGLMFSKITMAFFCIYFYVNQLAQVRAVYSEAAGLWWHFKYLSIGEMIANIVLNFFLGTVFGVNGIIMATIITAFAGSFIGCSYLTYKKLFNKSAKEYFFRNVIYGFVTLGGCVLSSKVNSHFILSNNIVGFVFRVAVTCIIAILYLLAVYLANNKTREDILNVIKPLIGSKKV